MLYKYFKGPLAMKKSAGNVLKSIFKFFLMTVLLIILYVTLVISLAHIPVNSNFTACKNDCVEVYLRSNGVHTDIVLPVKNELKDWSQVIDARNTKSGSADFKYMAVGWGDKGFYLDTPTWGDLTFMTAFKALFYLSNSAMHVTFYNTLKEGEKCRKVFIDKASYLKIVAFVDAGFKKDAAGKYQQILNASYGNTDLFFEAKGRYSLFYTCNTWTNNCLKAGDMKACLWTLFDTGIFYQYK